MICVTAVYDENRANLHCSIRGALACSLVFEASSGNDVGDATALIDASAASDGSSGTPDANVVPEEPTIKNAINATFNGSTTHLLQGFEGTQGDHLVVFVVNEGEMPTAVNTVRIPGAIEGTLTQVMTSADLSNSTPTVYVYQAPTPPSGTYGVTVTYTKNTNGIVAGVQAKGVSVTSPAILLTNGAGTIPRPEHPDLVPHQLLLYAIACSGGVLFQNSTPVWEGKLGSLISAIGLAAIQGTTLGTDVVDVGICERWRSAGILLSR